MFKQYTNDYKLGESCNGFLMAIVGEIDDQYVVHHHWTNAWGTWPKKHTKLIDKSNDVNYRKGWCINIKGVEHHINNFKKELMECVERELYINQ